MSPFEDNVCRFNAVAGGSGNYVVASAATGCKTPTDAAAVDGHSYRYYAQTVDGLQWEYGEGLWTALGTILHRTTVTMTSNGDLNAVNFTSPPEVDVFAAAAQFLEDGGTTGGGGGGGTPSDANPAMDGTAAPGASSLYSRGDHVHPSDTSRATVAYVDAQNLLKAPIASPAFTGNPTAPTPTAGDNDTSIATTAFVAGGISTGLAGKEPTIAPGTTSQYWRGDKNWATLDKVAVGLGNVDNTSDANKPVSTATQTALNLKEDKANKGVANGYASLDATAKVPAVQLPSYVDDVLEFANLAAFPPVGTAGIIYVAVDTGKIYRWSGSIYVEISPSPGSTDAVPEGAVNLYYTDERVDDRAAILIQSGTGISWSYNDAGGTLTPTVTLAPFSTTNLAEGTNLYYTNARASAAAPVQSVSGKTGAVTLVKGDVGLGNVDNTSDVNKPVSTAQQAALDLKAPLASPVFTGNPTAPTPTPGDNDTSIATTAFVAAAFASAGGGLPDAPSDGKAYGRLNAAWSQVLPITGGALTGSLDVTTSNAIGGTAGVTVKQDGNALKWFLNSNQAFFGTLTTDQLGGQTGIGFLADKSTNSNNWRNGATTLAGSYIASQVGGGVIGCVINSVGTANVDFTPLIGWFVTSGGGFVTGGNLTVGNSVASPASIYFGNAGNKAITWDGANYQLTNGALYVPSGHAYIGNSVWSGYGSATVGVYYFGNNGTKYLQCDGTNYTFATGYASANTPPSGDLSTKLATTAFVNKFVGLAAATDFNTVVANGTYYTVDAASVHAPSADFYYLEVEAFSAVGNGYVKQLAVGINTGLTYVRINLGGTWQPWRQVAYSGGHIVGEPSTGNAAAGEIGEYITASASTIAVTSGASKNIAQITLTPGDWDVSIGAVIGGTGTTTFQTCTMSISTVSATAPGGTDGVANMTFAAFTAMYAVSVNVSPMRMSVAANTVVYAVANVTFATAAATASATLRARRMR